METLSYYYNEFMTVAKLYFLFYLLCTQYRDFANCIAMRITCKVSRYIGALVNDTDL